MILQYKGDFYLSNLFRSPHKIWPNKLKPLNSSPNFEELNISQYPDEFKKIHQYAHNRMIMGSFRYGVIERQDLNCYDTAKEAHKRLNKYEKDGNLEHLIDAYNMIRIEYLKAKRSGHKLISIDDGEHATKER